MKLLHFSTLSSSNKGPSELENCSADLRRDLSTLAFRLFAIHSLCIGSSEAFHYKLAFCCTRPTLSCCERQQSDEQHGENRLNLFGGEKFNSGLCVSFFLPFLSLSHLPVNCYTAATESRLGAGWGDHFSCLNVFIKKQSDSFSSRSSLRNHSFCWRYWFAWKVYVVETVAIPSSAKSIKSDPPTLSQRNVQHKLKQQILQVGGVIVGLLHMYTFILLCKCSMIPLTVNCCNRIISLNSPIVAGQTCTKIVLAELLNSKGGGGVVLTVGISVCS